MRRYISPSKRRFNVYGYWQFTDIVGLGAYINKDAIVYVFSKRGEMVKAYTPAGRIVDFHITNLTKEYFVRIGRGHPPATCLAKGLYGSNCDKCDIYVAKFKLKKILAKKRGKR